MVRLSILFLLSALLAPCFFSPGHLFARESSPTGIRTGDFPGRMHRLIHHSDHNLPVYTFQVVKAFPHDPEAFTQGLIYQDGFFYESTGLRGSSSLRQIDPDSGRVLRSKSLYSRFFGEGLAAWGEKLIQLTWKEGTGFLYRASDLSPEGFFSYPGEGWGLTADANRLILSDGSPVLRFLDPEKFRETSRVEVRCGETPIHFLNDLEWMEGEILANIWRTDYIARISPETGQVVGWIDLTGLLPENERTASTGELNGIAYDAKGKRLFVTGKRWPRIFEIALEGK